MADNNEGLDNFDWEDNNPEIDFFGESSIEKDEEIESFIEKDDLEEGEELTEEKKEEILSKKESEISDSLFSEGEEEDDEEEEDEDEDLENLGKTEVEEDEETSTETVGEVGAKSYVTKLKEKGLINFELEDGVELTDELAEEILEDSYEEGIENRIEELFKDYPEPVKQLNKFIAKGGNFQEFLGALVKPASSSISVDADIKQESIQVQVVEQELIKQGFDKEHIDSQIQFLKDSGKLEKTSEVYFNKFIEADKLEKEALVKRQADAKAEEKEKSRQYKANLKSKVEALEDIKGLKLSKEDKESLPSFMSDKSVKMKNGQMITEMQKGLYDVLQDPDKSVLLAKLIKSDFDFSEFSTKASTKVTSEIKKNLQRTENKKKASSGGSRKKKTLADLFED